MAGQLLTDQEDETKAWYYFYYFYLPRSYDPDRKDDAKSIVARLACMHFAFSYLGYFFALTDEALPARRSPDEVRTKTEKNYLLIDGKFFTCYIDAMLSKNDIASIKNLLKGFSTKDDLKKLATRDDLKKLATRDDLKKLEKRLDKRFTNLFDFLDEDVMKNKKRLDKIEQVLNIPPVS